MPYRDSQSTLVYSYDLHVEYLRRDDGIWMLSVEKGGYLLTEPFDESLPTFEELGKFIAKFLYWVALENGPPPPEVKVA